jgi:dTDP-4-amino-4,6-dideoxygalactose transaminase
MKRVVGRVGLGDLSVTGEDPDITRCEQLLSTVLAVPGNVSLCSSGTAALASAYFGLGLERGAEVLVPTHTFRATATPLLTLGLRPVLCDSDPATGGIDLADAAARLTSRTQALVITHVWGRPVDLRAARTFAARHSLALVEDCSHAHGVRWRSEPVGTVGDVAVFSLGTTKMVTGGQAGAFVVRNDEIYERALSWGQPKNRVLRRIRDPRLRGLARAGTGNNLRPSPIAAILVADHLHRLPETTTMKNSNLERFAAALAAVPGLAPLPVADDRSHGTLYKFHCRWTGMPAQLPTVISRLREVGMRVRRPAEPLHRLPLFTDADLPALIAPDLRSRTPLAGKADFPATDRFLDGLLEFDTRDLYQPAGDRIATWSARLTR